MSEEHNLGGAVIVLDNHRAHLSGKVKELFADLQCELLFLPPATSVLNPIEVVWAQVKRQWRHSLLICDTESAGESWMVAELGRICASFSEESLERLASVHLNDALKMLGEAVEHYSQSDQSMGSAEQGPDRGWTNNI